MKKTTRILSLILALVFCAGLLSSCSKGMSANGGEASGETRAEVSDWQNEKLEYTFGKVTAVSATELSIDVYTTTGKFSDCTELDVGSLKAAGTSSALTLDENTDYFYTDNGSLIETAQDTLAEGSFIAAATDSSGKQHIILLDYIAPADTSGDSAANVSVGKVTEILEDGTLVLDLYKLTDAAADYTITDYANVKLDNYTSSGETRAVGFGEEVTIQTAQNGALTDAQAGDIAAGDTLVIYTVENGGTAVAVYPAA